MLPDAPSDQSGPSPDQQSVDDQDEPPALEPVPDSPTMKILRAGAREATRRSLSQLGWKP